MVSEILNEISLEQSTGNNNFPAGIFYSFRENKFWHYRRPDDNIFATLSVLLVLDGISHFFTEPEIQIYEKIKSESLAAIELYRNPKGRFTYNFWQTKPSRHFPNGTLFRLFKFFKLPDDIDDTALALLAKGVTKNELATLNDLLIKHSVKGKSVPSKISFNADKVYNTWFGENMPIEQDVCALCNLMLLRFQFQNKLTAYDKYTLSYLNDVIVSGEYRRNTFWVSRHYGTQALIAYHYARLWSYYQQDTIKPAIDKLKSEIPDLYNKETSEFAKMLLETAFFKISTNKPGIISKNKSVDLSHGENDFYSFLGAPLAPFGSDMASSRYFKIGWKCRAHELSLILENNLLLNSNR